MRTELPSFRLASLLVVILMICGPTIYGQLKLLPPPDFIKTADQPHSPLNITINERTITAAISIRSTTWFAMIAKSRSGQL
jgi:hypothetical protein